MSVVMYPVFEKRSLNGDAYVNAVALEPQIFPEEFRLLPAVVGPPGPSGSGGGGGGSSVPTLARITGEAIGALKAVRIDGSNIAWRADKDAASAEHTVGVSVGAAGSGGTVTIQTGGELFDAGWNWLPGPVWLGTNGSLTQTLPTTGTLFRVGVAAGPDAIIIEPQLIAVL